MRVKGLFKGIGEGGRREKELKSILKGEGKQHNKEEDDRKPFAELNEEPSQA